MTKYVIETHVHTLRGQLYSSSLDWSPNSWMAYLSAHFPPRQETDWPIPCRPGKLFQLWPVETLYFSLSRLEGVDDIQLKNQKVVDCDIYV